MESVAARTAGFLLRLTSRGVLPTPLRVAAGTPIQPGAARGVFGTVEIPPTLLRPPQDYVHQSDAFVTARRGWLQSRSPGGKTTEQRLAPSRAFCPGGPSAGRRGDATTPTTQYIGPGPHGGGPRGRRKPGIPRPPQASRHAKEHGDWL